MESEDKTKFDGNQENGEEKLDSQETGEREEYRRYNAPADGQRPYSSGRVPRPRIRREGNYSQDRPRRYTRTRNYNDDEGFRPEGFGAGLQGAGQQQHPYRPRFNNNGSYRQRRPYDNRGNYDNRGEGYNRQYQGYRPRYGSTYEEGQQGYRPRQNYNNRGGYNSGRGNYSNRGGYGNRGGAPGRNYGDNYAQGTGNHTNRYRAHTADYDPNAKYSMKKRIEYKEENYDPNEPIRLNKFLANAGVCSRREADEFITAGVVSVNGAVVTELGTKVLRTDEVKFHDQPVTLEKKVYVLLNKPKDYVTTVDDPQQRKTVMDLVKDACKERIYPVGRLDRNTTGVLLLTNDGDLASKLTHPKFLKKKVYHVHLDKNVTAHDLEQIREGIELEDGPVKVDAVEYADPEDKKQVGIEIHSGKNHIVRRIFESLGYRVTKLDRVLFAGLTKKNVRRGDWRYLTEEEVNRLRMGAYE